MSIHARLAGTEEPKLPVWGTITDFTRVMDGDMTFNEVATKYELSQAEQVQAGQILTAVGTMVTARAATMGEEVARSVVNAKMQHALLRAELGTNTEAEFLAVFGL